MDDVITRIVDIEKQCSAAIEEAQRDYEKKIEVHKRLLEEKKADEFARITAAENDRLTQAVEAAKKQFEAESLSFKIDSESRLQDPVLKERIKQDIISILLEG